MPKSSPERPGNRTSSRAISISQFSTCTPAGSGWLNTLSTYRTGAVGSPTADTTTWHHNPYTGLIDSKTYADGSHEDYTFSNPGQLTGVNRFGGAIVGSRFTYNNAGELTGSTWKPASGPAVCVRAPLIIDDRADDQYIGGPFLTAACR